MKQAPPFAVAWKGWKERTSQNTIRWAPDASTRGRNHRSRPRRSWRSQRRRAGGRARWRSRRPHPSPRRGRCYHPLPVPADTGCTAATASSSPSGNRPQATSLRIQQGASALYSHTAGEGRIFGLGGGGGVVCWRYGVIIASRLILGGFGPSITNKTLAHIDLNFFVTRGPQP